MIKLGCNAMLRVPEDQRIDGKENPLNWMDIETLIDAIAKMRLDFTDLQLDRGFRSRDLDYLGGIKRKCLKLGLPIGFLGVGGGFVGAETRPDRETIGISLTEVERRRRVEEAKRAVDLAAFMSAPLIRIFAGGIPEHSEHADRLWAEVVSCFQQVADYAADKGIFIGLHNHPPALAPVGEDIIRLLQDADRENITFILDTGQWWGSPGASAEGVVDQGVEFYEFMEETAPYATYVRAKIYKIDSGREEWIDYERVMSILRKVEFNGNMSIVYEGRGNRCSDLVGIELAVAYLRKLLDEC